jgi:hypothetical protein
MTPQEHLQEGPISSCLVSETALSSHGFGVVFPPDESLTDADEVFPIFNPASAKPPPPILGFGPLIGDIASSCPNDLLICIHYQKTGHNKKEISQLFL